MHSTISKEPISTLAIDLAKSSFHLHGADTSGHQVVSKPVSRQKLFAYVAQLPPCTVVMEACGGANYFARQFSEQGHSVKLIAPQFVKPFVKSNKSDAADAQAICEASQRPTMRYVQHKSINQQDIQSIHRARSLVKSQRVALSNQIRGLLSEYGIVFPVGLSVLRKQIVELLSGTDRLTPLFIEMLTHHYGTLCHLDAEIEFFDRKIDQIARADERCRRLMTIPGIGPIAATALLVALGDGSSFASGREAAAYLGLVPRQHSTGGRSNLLGISKRGDKYLRSLLIHGGRTVVLHAAKHDDYRSQWITEVAQRRNVNIASVAVANKNVRTAWALLTRNSEYKTTPLAA